MEQSQSLRLLCDVGLPGALDQCRFADANIFKFDAAQTDWGCSAAHGTCVIICMHGARTVTVLFYVWGSAFVGVAMRSVTAGGFNRYVLGI